MKNVFLKIICVVLLISIFGCTKKEIITQNITRDTVLTNNTSPPYTGTSSVIVDNFVNRLYIDLIGEEPADSLLSAEVTYLKTNTLSADAKDTVVQKVISKYDYYVRFYELTKANMLEGVDSATIAEWIWLFEYQKKIAQDSGQISYVQIFQFEIDRLTLLQTLPTDLYNASITINDFFQRIVENYFYDEINMGSENFVKSCFENLLHRFPTDAELADAIAMVDGEPSQIFLKSGNSKGDFVDIITSSTDFYEGLVYDTYNRFLSRKPVTTEMSDGTNKLLSNINLSSFHKSILKGKEYAGF